MADKLYFPISTESSLSLDFFEIETALWRIIQDAATIKGLQAMLAEKDKSINELLRLVNEKSQNEIQLTSQLEQCEATIEDMNTIINQHEANHRSKG